MYKLFVVVSRYESGVSTQILEFNDENEANIAYDRLKEHAEDSSKHSMSVVKLY